MTASEWEDRGRELGVSLDACHAIVVVGADAESATQVALGIARVQSQHRPVSVGDLFGDAPLLVALAPGEDPPGIIDSFQYGVSLNRIAHAVDNSNTLFVLRTGSEDLDAETLFPHPRWKRLTAGFREIGALLVLVASADAARLRELVDATDGAVVVGDVVPPDLAVAQSLAWLRPVRRGHTALAIAPVAEPSTTSVPATLRRSPQRTNARRLAGVAGVVVALGLAGLMIWFLRRPLVDYTPKSGVAQDTPVAHSAVAGTLLTERELMQRVDSVRGDSLRMAGVVLPADSFPVLIPANPGDSSKASAFGVRLETTTTRSGAILTLRSKYQQIAAATYGIDPRTRFHLLVGGAFITRGAADSMLAGLRERHVLAPTVGTVVSVPLAFLVQSQLSEADVGATRTRYVARGYPVYALQQGDGSYNLYFGAYETPQHAAVAVPSVRDAGLTPTLVYRLGRIF